MTRGRARIARPAVRAHPRHDRAAQRVSRRSDPDARRLGARPRRTLSRRPASARRHGFRRRLYDDYPVINVMQLEDLGFCRKGEGRRIRAPQHVHHRRHAAAQYLRRTIVGRAGRRGRRLSRAGRSDPAADRRSALGAQVENARLGLVSGFGMINYDRGLCTGAAILGCRMTEPLNKPKPRNPVRATAPADVAAGRAQPGGVAADRCCRRRPVRAADVPRLRQRAVSAALGVRTNACRIALEWRETDGCGRADLRHRAASRERALLSRARAAGASAWCGSTPGRPCSRTCTAIARCAGARARARASRQERAGGADRASAEGYAEHGGRPDAARNDQRSEIPQGARSPTARARPGRRWSRALVEAGADIVWVGIAEPWKQAPRLDACKLRRSTIVPLDVTDERSVRDLAGVIGGKVDILDQHRRIPPRPRHRGSRHRDRARRDGGELSRSVASRAGVRPGDARARRRGHGAGDRLGQSAVDLRARRHCRRTAHSRPRRRRPSRCRRTCAPRCARRASAW